MTQRMKYEAFNNALEKNVLDICQGIIRKDCLKGRKENKPTPQKRIIGLYVKNFGNRKKVFD